MNKRIKKKIERQQINLISKQLKRKYNVKGIETPKYSTFNINNVEIIIYAKCNKLNHLNNKLVVKFDTIDQEYGVVSINKNTLDLINDLVETNQEYHIGKAVKGETLNSEDILTTKQYIKEGQKKLKEIAKNNAKIEKNISKLVEKLNTTKNINNVKVCSKNKLTDIIVKLESDLKPSVKEKLVERIMNNVSKVKETLVDIHNINITIMS